MDDLTFVFRSLRGRCYGNQFWVKSVKLANLPSFITLAFETIGGSICRWALNSGNDLSIDLVGIN